MPAPNRNKTYKIGITGGICSGKSVVRNMIVKNGMSAMDTMDVIYSILSGNKQLVREITDRFGAEVVDATGHLSKKKLEKMQFDSPIKRKYFQDTVNPGIREEMKRFLFGPLGSYIRAVESPWLFETGTEHLFDEIWVMKIDPAVQIKRLMERDRLLMEQAELRIISEMQQEQKIEMATRIIDNSGERQATEAHVRGMLDEIKNRLHLHS